MTIVYNAQGEAKIVDPVDAREHIETGRWFTQPPEGAQSVAENIVSTVEPSPRRRITGAR